MIKDLPDLDKPREKAIKNGVESLSDSELLAIIIRTGAKKQSALDLARNILSQINGIANYNSITLERLSLIKGVGLVKAITILSAIELGKRSMFLSTNTTKITNAKDVYKNFRYYIYKQTQEIFIILFMDAKNGLINYKIIYKGTSKNININPKEVFKEAYIHNASSIILVHNHPNGLCFPSKNDYVTTNNLLEISRLLEIPIKDHVILTNDNYYSFWENGDIK